MQPPEQEQDDQRRPDLDSQSIFGGTDEGLDLQLLLEDLEEELDLPAVLVDGGRRRRAESQVAAEQDDLLLVLLVPDRDATEEPVRACLDGARARQTDGLVGRDSRRRTVSGIITGTPNQVTVPLRYGPQERGNRTLADLPQALLSQVAEIHIENARKFDAPLVFGQGTGDDNKRFPIQADQARNVAANHCCQCTLMERIFGGDLRALDAAMITRGLSINQEKVR